MLSIKERKMRDEEIEVCKLISRLRNKMSAQKWSECEIYIKKWSECEFSLLKCSSNGFVLVWRKFFISFPMLSYLFLNFEWTSLAYIKDADITECDIIEKKL